MNQGISMLAPGSRVEDYEVVRLVAIGAMCHVYEAHMTQLGRPVAVKVLHWMWCSDEGLVTRFLNEARILQTIRHPHVVSLLASGKLPDGAPYMVLEWVPGNLARALVDAGGALDPSTAARIALQIAAALAALHKLGIVHRDLKPANVLLDQYDLAGAQVRLADLGLAKVQPVQDGERIAVAPISTGGSTLLGTLDYMAPEQWIKSKTADPRADVYSLGAVRRGAAERPHGLAPLREPAHGSLGGSSGRSARSGRADVEEDSGDAAGDRGGDREACCGSIGRGGSERGVGK
jgi:serine/threonine-protein kinase